MTDKGGGRGDEPVSGLRRFVRDLTGGVDDELLGALRDQLLATCDAVAVLRDALAAEPEGAPAGEIVDPEDAPDAPSRHLATVAERVEDLERRGDDARARLVHTLSRSLTTPIDREDLFRVSRSFDDVLDNLRDFARELQLYRPDVRADIYTGILDDVDEGIAALRQAVDALAEDRGDLLDKAKVAKRSGGAIRRGFHEQVARLFTGELTMNTLKHRELLRRLDVVGLRLGEAGDALEDGALKRGS